MSIAFDVMHCQTNYASLGTNNKTVRYIIDQYSVSEQAVNAFHAGKSEVHTDAPNLHITMKQAYIVAPHSVTHAALEPCARKP